MSPNSGDRELQPTQIWSQTTGDLVFFDKPDGWSTHSPGEEREGVQEILEGARGEKLWVVHRLDKSTSGALVFARSSVMAEALRQQFAERKVQKLYHFVTAASSTESSLEIQSRIEMGDKTPVNLKDHPEPNASTKFERVKRTPFFELWAARPATGKTHQVRLHAQQAGLPILGDLRYGGAHAPRVFLHASELTFTEPLTKPLQEGTLSFSSPLPRCFERLWALKDSVLTKYLCAIDRRQRWFHFLDSPNQVLRLMDRVETGHALDLLGPVLWGHWYSDSDPDPREWERWQCLARLLDRPLLLQQRWDRGKAQGSAKKWMEGEVPEVWTAQEGPNTFEFRSHQGESSGLFLDQRINRKTIGSLARDKTLLNLFAYTGGFSVEAARQGASNVTTVDLSSSTIQWAKRNFEINGLPAKNHEFFAADCFFFLDRAVQRKRTWDLIVLDPPIFSRSKEKVFRIERDFPELLRQCKQCLSKNGRLLVTSHFEDFTAHQWERLMNDLQPKEVKPISVDLDFHRSHSLRGFWLRF